MTDSSARNHEKSIFRNWRYVVGWLLAAAGLIWVLRDIHPSKLALQLAGIDWRWVALAMVCDVLSYVVQAVRWQLLLKPVGMIKLSQSTQAIFAGLFTNEVLPMRPGEVVRCYLAALWMRASFVAILPSIIVERLFDGVWIAMGIGMAAIFAPLPEDLIEAGETFGAAIALIVVLFAYLVLRRPRPGGWRIAVCSDGSRCARSSRCSRDWSKGCARRAALKSFIWRSSSRCFFSPCKRSPSG